MIEMHTNENMQIDVSRLSAAPRVISSELIAPAKERVSSVVVANHTAEPIKSMDDIIRISRYLIENGRYRDNMLFIVGINFGLRVSDLRELRFCDLINDNLVFKDTFPVFEKKTRNTRKRRKNRYITINQAVMDAVILYLQHAERPSMSDYLFRSESNHGKSVNAPLDIKSIDRILKGIAEDLHLTTKVSTHTLRKTFCYHQMLMSHNDPRKLLLLQKIMNHSTPAQTLDYIGITGEEIQEAYRSLNLGSTSGHYLMECNIIEKEEDAV